MRESSARIELLTIPLSLKAISDQETIDLAWRQHILGGDATLGKSNISLLRVAKITDFLATF